MNYTHTTRTLIIVNPAAARTRRTWASLHDALKRSGVGFDVHETGHRGDAEQQARRALEDGYNTIVAVGGDGTLSETASGFFALCKTTQTFMPVNPHAALAVLPSGTGDDFARGLASTRAPLEAWLQKLIAYLRTTDEADDATMTRRIDLLSASATNEAGARHRFICLNAATFGIGADVAARVAGQGQTLRRLGGEARFALAALGALAAWRARRVRIVIDGGRETFDVETNLLAITNGRFAGGGMMFAPDASVDDGCLEVVTTDRIGRSVLLRELTRIHRGGHVANPHVRVIKCRRARIETCDEKDRLSLEADGDVRGWTPAEFEIMPSALQVVV